MALTGTDQMKEGADDGKLGLKINSSPDINSSDEEDGDEDYNDCIINPDDLIVSTLIIIIDIYMCI